MQSSYMTKREQKGKTIVSYARQSEVVLFLFLGSGLLRFSKSGQVVS